MGRQFPPLEFEARETADAVINCVYNILRVEEVTKFDIYRAGSWYVAAQCPYNVDEKATDSAAYASRPLLRYHRLDIVDKIQSCMSID